MFPILWIETWEWFGKQPCERRSRNTFPSKNSVIELKFGRFFVQLGCSKQQPGKVCHLETPHDILESFKTTSVFGGTVCVCHEPCIAPVRVDEDALPLPVSTRVDNLPGNSVHPWLWDSIRIQWA